MPVRLQLRTKLGGNRVVQPGSKWYHVQLLMIWLFMGNETFLNSTLNNDEWKWNWYGTFFHPAVEISFFFFWSQGCFLQSSLVGLSRSSPARLPRAFWACWWGRWNLRFVCSSLYLFYRGQIALFVCSRFWWLEIVTDKRIIGFWGMFLYGHPFMSVLSSGCAGDVSWFFVFKTVSARQWSHYFNILDIYYLLTFTVIQPTSQRVVGGHGCLGNALHEILKQKCNPIILNSLLKKALRVCLVFLPVYQEGFHRDRKWKQN